MSVIATLRDYQHRAMEFCLTRRRTCIFAEQGLGKTRILCGVIERLTSPTFTALLIVPLVNLQSTWVHTIETFLPGISICRTWEEFKKTKGSRVLLLNYEAVRGKLTRKLIKFSWTLIAYDEAHRLKKRSSKASRASARFKSGGTYRVALTGTPVEQAPQDLWAILRFVDPDVLGTSWSDFDEKWLRPCGFMGYDRKFKEKLLPKFLDLVSPVFMRLTKKDVGNLPPMSIVAWPVDLLGQQARVYRELDRDMVTTLDDGTEVMASLEITKLVRLQQVIGGFIRVDGRSIRVGRAKVRMMRRIVAREELPIVIFVKYREELEDVVAELTPKYRVAVIRGGKKGDRKHRATIIEKFQGGEYDVLVCMIKAGGVGIDLFRACVAIVYSATFSSIDWEQAISRIHRIGQTRPVRIYLIPGRMPDRKTVDDTIRLMIATKRTVSQQVLDHRRQTMAKKEEKKAAAAAPTKEKKAPTPPKIERPKYGVPELAEALGIKPASVRVQLRNAEIEKSGKLYGWDSKSEMQEVINRLKAAKPEKAKAAPKKSKKAAEPADDGDDEVEAEEDEDEE